jgi:hypothetical protein
VNITISGASGLIGRRLLKVLSSAGHSLHVLSRHAGTNLPTGVGLLSVWDPMKGQPPRESLNRADVIIHLAGEPVAQRWTGEAKQRIRDTRVAGTRHLVEALSALERRPAALVCASAVGYYGSTGDEILDESAPPGSGFLPEVCTAWEAEARAAEALGMRVVSIRIGIALDTRGGALPQMSNPFRFGVGGRLGSGRQWMSWIHLSDLADLFRFAVENPVRGPINGVAPNPVQNVEFTRELGRALKRPALFVVPKLALKLVFGEMSELLVEGQRVIPRAAESAGFRFRYPELGPALADLLR